MTGTQEQPPNTPSDASVFNEKALGICENAPCKSQGPKPSKHMIHLTWTDRCRLQCVIMWLSWVHAFYKQRSPTSINVDSVKSSPLSEDSELHAFRLALCLKNMLNRFVPWLFGIWHVPAPPHCGRYPCTSVAGARSQGSKVVTNPRVHIRSSNHKWNWKGFLEAP